MGVDKQPETFAELVETWKLQPYQRDILNSLYGMPVRIVEDPVDPRVGYIFNEEVIRESFRYRPLVILDEGVTFEPDERWFWRRWSTLFAD